MLKYIFFCYFFCFSTIVKSQSVTISDELNIRNDNGYEILGRYKGNILLFRDRIGESEIVAFDEQMRQRWQKTIEYNERRPQILDAIGGKDYFSIVYRAKVQSGVVVKISRFDAAANFIDSITPVQYSNRFVNVSPHSIYSENKKIVLIYNYDQNQHIEATVVDLDNMKVLWTRSIIIDESSNALSEQVIVTNEGFAYFIYEKEANVSLFSSAPPQYSIYKIDLTHSQKFQIVLEDYTNFSAEFAYNNVHRQLHLVAAVSEKNKSKINSLLWVQNIGSPNAMQYLQGFSEETTFAITGKKASNSKGLSDLKIQEIAFRKDGGLIVLIEEVKQFSRAMNSMGRPFNNSDMPNTRVTLDFYHEALIAASFNPDGSQQWEKVMPKKQFSQDDDGIFASYGLLKTPAALHLLFNDEIKSETTTSEYVLTGGGTVHRHSLFNTAQQEIALRFRDVLQTGSDEFVLPSEYHSRLKLVKVKY